MKLYYITFRSVTFAQRGEKLLQQHGHRCALQRTPRWMEEQGCGYCLRMMTGDIQPAVELLRGSRIPMRKVYVQQEKGDLEEMAL